MADLGVKAFQLVSRNVKIVKKICITTKKYYNNISAQFPSTIAKHTKAFASPNFAIELVHFSSAQAILRMAKKVVVIFGRQFCTRKAKTVGFYSIFNKQSGTVWHALIYNTRLAKKRLDPTALKSRFFAKRENVICNKRSDKKHSAKKWTQRNSHIKL